MWDYTGYTVTGVYLDDIVVTGKVLSSRVKYGGKVQHTVELNTPITVYGAVRETVLLDEDQITEKHNAMKTVELNQYTDEKKTQSVFVVTDGIRYIIDKEDGYVEFFNTKESADNAINDTIFYTFAKPFCRTEDNLYIFKSKWNEIGIYNDNMECLVESSDIYPLLNWIDENNKHDKFMVFTFPKEDNSDDYSSDYDTYDISPSYYDPRYDGPMHYIPPGNH